MLGVILSCALLIVTGYQWGVVAAVLTAIATLLLVLIASVQIDIQKKQNEIYLHQYRPHIIPYSNEGGWFFKQEGDEIICHLRNAGQGVAKNFMLKTPSITLVPLKDLPPHIGYIFRFKIQGSEREIVLDGGAQDEFNRDYVIHFTLKKEDKVWKVEEYYFRFK